MSRLDERREEIRARVLALVSDLERLGALGSASIQEGRPGEGELHLRWDATGPTDRSSMGFPAPVGRGPWEGR